MKRSISFLAVISCFALSATAALAEQLQPRLGIACSVLDPFDGMLGVRDGALRAAAPGLAIASGLARRSFD